MNEISMKENYGFDAKKVLNLTQNLIRIRTCHPEGNELDIVKYILSLFEDYGLASDVVHHGGNRASLVMTIRGRDPSQKTAVVGHTDTIVPLNQGAWTHSPYAADFEDGIIYGNGASNGKGGVAAMINAATHMLENGIAPKNDVVLCFTADGDGNGLGGAAICDGGFLQGVSEVIFADPTNAEIGIAQKGVMWLEVTARGACRHVLDASSSVDPLDRVISFSRKLHETLKKKPSHPVLGKSLSYVTGINSGDNWVCTLPGEVRATFDIRYSPLVGAEDILHMASAIAAQEEAAHPGLEIGIRTLLTRLPLGISDDAPIIQEISACYKNLKRRPAKMGLGFYSDSSCIVPRLGVPFALLGPGDWIFTDRGDEFVSLDSILFMSRIYADYLTRG